MKSGHVRICAVWGVSSALVAAELSAALAGGGEGVLLVDASAGGELRNIYGVGASALAGIPARGDLPGAVHATGVDNVGLLAGAGAVLDGSDLGPVRALVRGLRDLGPQLAVVDLGGEGNTARLDLLSISSEMVITVEPGGEAIQRGFNLLKDFVYSRMNRVFSENPIVADLVAEATDTSRGDCVRSFADLCARISEANERSAARALAEVRSYRPALVGVGDEGVEAAEVLKNAAATYLGLDSVLLGSITVGGKADPSLGEKLVGLLGAAPALPETQEPGDGVWTAGEGDGEAGSAADLPFESPVEVFGYNDNVKHDGTVFHVQTEVSGGENPVIETVVYHGGRVFFSKRIRWSEVQEAGSILSGVREFSKRQHEAAKAAVKMNRIAFKGYK